MADGVQLNNMSGGQTVDTELSIRGHLQRVKVVLGAIDADGGDVAATNPLPTSITDGSLVTLGAQADAAAVADTSTASLIALFKRLLQRLTTFMAQLPAALTGSGNLKVALQESTVTQVVSGAVGVTGTVAVSDAAQLPAALGQTTMLASLPVVVASNQAAFPVNSTLQAGSNIVGKVTTDQTTHGATDLVAADITKVAGAAVATGHGTAAGAVRVELPTDGTGVVILGAGAAAVGTATVVGGAAAGAAVAGNPVLVAGKDGSGNAQDLATDTSGNANVVGNIASGATDSGNPVKIGGVASTTAPTAVTAGQRINAWLGLNGEVVIGVASSLADGANSPSYIPDTSGAARPLAAQSYNWNGANCDRQRGNMDVTLLASATRSSTTAASDQVNYNGRGVRVVFSVTVAATGGLTVAIQGKDSISGNYYQLHANFTQVTGTGTFVYDVYPGIGAAAGGITAVASAFVPRTWRVNVTHADGSTWTYSVSAVTLL